jgi:hypothetical protein
MIATNLAAAEAKNIRKNFISVLTQSWRWTYRMSFSRCKPKRVLRNQICADTGLFN